MTHAIRKQIDLYPTREPHRVVDPVVLILRQTPWGARNGETLIELQVVEKNGSQYCVGSGVALKGTLLSIAAGVTGFGLAYYMYVARPETPERIAISIHELYRLVLNKYYVDELYYAAIVDPIVDISRAVLWKTVDAGIIDGTVNGAGTTARFFGGKLRQIQSGNIRSYGGWVAIGAALILAYFLYMGVQ